MTGLAVSATSAGNRTFNWLPWLIGVGLLALIVGRMLYLGTVNDRFDLAYFTRALLESLKLGSLYALIALGYTMVYGIIRLINFAHGEVFMVGAFLTYFLFTFSPYPWPVALIYGFFVALGTMRVLVLLRGAMRDPLVIGFGLALGLLAAYLLATQTVNLVFALLFSMLLTGVLGIVIDRVAYLPLRTAPRNSLLITAIAVSFLLQNLGLLVFTNRQTPFRPDTPLLAPLTFTLGEGSVSTTWLFAAIPLVTAVLVIGGIGSLPGAVIGALVIGFAENFVTAIFPRTENFAGVTEFKDTFAFILLIVVLLVRPSGIVGEDLSEKV